MAKPTSNELENDTMDDVIRSLSKQEKDIPRSDEEFMKFRITKAERKLGRKIQRV